MPGAVAILMEGVVLDEHPTSYGASVPIPEGVAMARLLYEAGPLYYVTAATEEIATHWLRVNGLKYSRVVAPEPQDTLLDRSKLQRRQISRLRASAGLWMALTADPGVAAWAFLHGQPTLTFSHPRHSALEPSQRPWRELAAATVQARELQAQAVEEVPEDGP